MVELIYYYKKELEHNEDFIRTLSIANILLNTLNEAEIIALIKEANRPKVSSSIVQNVFIKEAENLGFKSEATGLFASYENKNLRPDYYLKLNENLGILLEVERGKTTINNMDILDFWKCHICKHANYLFLMVPRELKQNDNGSARKEFATVKKRLKSFFEVGNYTNVDGLFLFGY